MTLKVLIADDEVLARERLRQMLKAEPDIQVVAECVTGTETVKAIQTTGPDVVLLDVTMPEMDGFQVIQALDPTRLPVIVFVTAHSRFAIRAFEAAAADYLLKPFDRDRLQAALQHARETAERNDGHPNVEKMAHLVATLRARPRPVERFAVRYGRRILFVKPEEIDWIRSADNYSELHVGEHMHLLRRTLGELEEQLTPGQFVRISRSLMVNVDQIQQLRAKSHGDYHVLLKGGLELTASRNYRSELQKLFGKIEP